tara:strand:+ start:257 stop:640 length:384 start_codon:yes stop_codon:yes gene_type:complete
MSESDIVRRLKSELAEARSDAQVFETFMHEYYTLKERSDELLLFLYGRLGKMGVADCETCIGTGGVMLGIDKEGVAAWSHPVTDPCEQCHGVGKDTTAAMARHHDEGKKRERNKDRFKKSRMEIVKD